MQPIDFGWLRLLTVHFFEISKEISLNYSLKCKKENPVVFPEEKPAW